MAELERLNRRIVVVAVKITIGINF